MSSVSQTPSRKRKQPHPSPPPAASPPPDSIPASKSTAKTKSFRAECALSLEGTLFGGYTLGVAGSHVRSVLRSVNSRDVAPWMGLDIEFPLGASAEDDGFGTVHSPQDRLYDTQPYQFLRVLVKFPRGGFSFSYGLLDSSARHRFPGAKKDPLLLDVFINDGAEVTVEGLGMPFANSDHPEIEGWLNRFEPVANGMTLIDVFNQRNFTIVVDHGEEYFVKHWNEANLRPPFSYPYGTNHSWDEDRFPSQIHDNKGRQFLPAWTYSDDNAHLAAMSQSQVQDRWWLHEAAVEISRQKLPAYFIKPDQADGDRAHLAIIPLPEDFRNSYDSAWRQLTSNSYPLKLDLYKGAESVTWDAKIQDRDKSIRDLHSKHGIKKTDLAKRRVDSVSMFHPEAAPSNPLAFPGIAPPTMVQGKLVVSAEMELRMKIHRLLFLGTGFWPILKVARTQPPADNNMVAQMPSPLPMVNLLNITDDAYTEALLEEILLADRPSFRKYLAQRPLGLGVITGAPGFGKTTALALGTLAMSASIGKVYGSAPTHVATDNFAARLCTMTERVTERYNSGKQGVAHVRRKLVVRAYKEHEEYAALRHLLEHPLDSDNALHDLDWNETPEWKLNLSTTFWLLVCLRSPGVRELHADDSVTLHELQDHIDKREDLDRLRAVAVGDIGWDDYTNGTTTPKEALEDLLRCIITAADIICTPPSLSHTDPRLNMWKNCEARGIAVDDAASMARPDLYCIWGNTLLPCLMAGDGKESAPRVLALKSNDGAGNAINRFGLDAMVSGLLWFKRTAWPVFRLRTQLRMAVGLFEVCQREVYRDLAFNHGPDTDISLPCHGTGRALESYINTKYPDVKPAQTGTFQPLFVHCKGAGAFTDPITSSKWSYDQVEIALDFLSDFVMTANVDPSHLAIITPYQANVEAIKHMRNKAMYKALSPMRPAATVDSFQGQESDISVLIMGNTNKSGVDFAAERVNIMLSRQRSGLLIFGDINSAGKARNKKVYHMMKSLNPKLKPYFPRATPFQNVQKWLLGSGRVATVQVKSEKSGLEGKIEPDKQSE
ncbi:AAA domain-containing protein [Ilyonectria robusta]|uniref:AAA domain-containing protein n=1 Tax=Ilyonectria robusta TaxID=1079257 RepID=UPI001E8D94F7|nr:AAA domain-containing protein [Ilyonectria robusta]KAH8667822.1 AAA domain-containing protein [Ilyonectria robusta]